MRHTFRTKPRLWFTEVVLPLLLLGVPLFLLATFTQSSLRLWLLIGICCVVIVVILIRQVIPLWRNRIQLDDDGLSGYVANIGTFAILWRDIVVAECYEILPKETGVRLVAEGKLLVISLIPFDGEKIWRILQSRVPSPALEKDAYKSLSNYQEWEAENIRLVSDSSMVVRIKGSPTAKVVAWLSIVTCVFVATMILLQRGNWHVGLTVMMLALTLPGLFLLILLSGSVDMDGQSVTLISPLGHYRIRWDEVRQIESGRFSDWLIFYGPDKRLAFMGPIMWSKSSREQALRFVQAQIQQRNIEFSQIRSVLPKFSKNTRID